MIAVVDTSVGKLLETVDREKIGFDFSDIVLVEAELIDLESGDSNPDPRRGLNVAFVYTSEGRPVVVAAEREYDELDIWRKLFLNPNVAFCQKPITSENFHEALKKIMPEAGT